MGNCKSTKHIQTQIFEDALLPSLKLTAKALKNGGWKTSFLSGRPIFSGYMLVFGGVRVEH